MAMPRKTIGLTLLTLIIVFILFAITWVEYQDAKVKSNIALAKNDLNTIAQALEAYGMNNNVYPRSDLDSEGNGVLPKALVFSWSASTSWESTRNTTKRLVKMGRLPEGFIPPESYQKDSTYRMRIFPAGHYLEKLLYDPFNNRGKGLYGYSGGPVTGSFKTTWPASGWIATSYGPDRVPGNTGDPDGQPIDPSKAWSDSVLGFELKGSDLTYDPTNGLRSPGDIWRRGP